MDLQALVALGPRPPIACMVKDFCVAGVFIQIDMRQLRFVQPRTPAVLHFALNVGGAVQEFQMALTVCRVTGSGLGVAFKNPDPKIVALLHGLAQPEPPKPVPQTDAAVSDTQRRFVPEFGRILPKLAELVERSLAHIAAEFTRSAADGLFIAARDARSNREQTLFVDAQTQFRRRIPAITEQVPSLMVKAVAILDNPLRDRVGNAASASGLSLVDKDEFEEFLTVSELVAEMEGRLKEPLFDLNKRLSFLARREVEDNNNPFGPTVICQAFAESMKGFLTDLAVSGVVYQMLRKCLDANLQRLYEEANALLIEQNILPVIEREKFGVKKASENSRQPTNSPLPLEASKAGLGASSPASLADSIGPLSRTQGSIWQHSSGRNQRGPHGGMARTAPPGGNPGGGTFPPAGYGSGQEAAANWAARTGNWPAEAAPRGLSSSPPGRAGGGGSYGPVGAASPGGLAGGSYGAFGVDATFSGFGYGPALGGGPSFERALSVAQNQLALRRQLAPGGGEAGPSDPRQAYSPAQIADGLTELQHKLTATAEPEWLGADMVKQNLVEAMQARGFAPKAIGQTENDAIEIIVNLFQALLQDARVGEFAKGNLKRLQGSVHKAAQIDQEFFATTQHPLRQLLNRVALMDLSPGEQGQRQQSRLREIIDGVNLSYDRDSSVIQPLLPELEGFLKEQRAAFDANVSGVVAGCEEQQRFLRERRDRAGEAAQPQPTFPAELQRWVTRAKGLRVGDRLLMNANTKAPYPVTLVWIGDDFNPYVLADARGNKSASLTLQQVAMYLRRGLVKILTDDDESAVDRALYGVVNRLHEQVVEQATHDTLTGLLTRKSFMQAIEAKFPPPNQSDPGAVLCEFSIENLKAVNEQFGTATGDQLIKQISDEFRAQADPKNVVLGRLGGGEWGMYWSRGGIQVAYRETQALLEKIRELTLPAGPGAIPRLVAGMAAVEAELAQVDPLMTAVHEACGVARSHPDSPIYVTGTDAKQRVQLEQMMAYVSKAIERQRLALLFHEVRALGKAGAPAAKVVVSAEDRNGKLVPPALFTQAVCNSAHAYAVDFWTLHHTLLWMASHSEECERFSAFVIPLSRAALDKDDISNVIVNELMETAVPPAKVCFEIEDKVALAKLTETGDLINTLREFGCQFILSDFGGVQGNYEYLKELAVDFVTIPSSFIVDGRQDPKDLAIARSINELAHFMGKLTIAKAQGETGLLELLREMKVDFVHDVTRATRLIMETDGRDP
jgi:diguanylate cyclase (GGDEF)-like protein